MNEGLIDRIFESAFVPELWPGVLDELSRIADARGGSILAVTPKALRWTASEGLLEVAEIFAREDWASRSLRRPRLLAARHAGFLGDHDLFTREEMDRDPIYCDFLRPRGLGWAAATSVALPTGDKVIVTLERDYVRGPVEDEVMHQLDALRPHLARSTLVSARLQLERARVAGETLALIGLPALVIDDQGMVVEANQLVEPLADHVRWHARDRISLKDPRADALYRQALAELALHTVTVRSFAVCGSDVDPAMVAHLVPIRGTARDIFVRCAAVLVLTRVATPQAPPAELIQSLFDLTPAEARVARGLAAGEAVEEIASSRRVSRNTVRTQLRAVMEKTGCDRQAEVVALLGRLTILSG